MFFPQLVFAMARVVQQSSVQQSSVTSSVNLVPNPDFAIADDDPGSSSTGAAHWHSRTAGLFKRVIFEESVETGSSIVVSDDAGGLQHNSNNGTVAIKSAMQWNSSAAPGVYATCAAAIDPGSVVPGNVYYFSAEIRTKDVRLARRKVVF